MGHENIPSKHVQTEDPLDFTPYLRDMEEQDVEYLLSLSMIQEGKGAIFCGRVGCEAVAHKASVKVSRCWAPFPVPAPVTWASRGPVFSLQVANGARVMDALQETLQSGSLSHRSRGAWQDRCCSPGCATSVLLPSGSSRAGKGRKKNGAYYYYLVFLLLSCQGNHGMVHIPSWYCCA